MNRNIQSPINNATENTLARLSIFKLYFLRFLKSDTGKALLIALSWQLLMTLLGILIERGLIGFVKPGANLPVHTLLSHTLRWDSYWYEGITHGLYSLDVAAPAFYPLFPLLVMGMGFLTLNTLGVLASGLLLNTIALWLAVLALYKIAQKFLNRKFLAWCVVGLFLTSPAAFFLHVFYGALAFGAYYFALEKRWAFMGVSLGLLTASRIPAILIVALCLLEYLRSSNWDIKQIVNKNALWFLLSPIGIVLYSTYLKLTMGDFLGMLHSYKLWTFQVFNLNFIATYYSAVMTSFNGIFGTTPYSAQDILVNFILPVVALAILFIASLIAVFRIKGRGIPLGVAGLLSFVMFTLNSNVNSVHRYVLPCAVVYVATVFVLSRFKDSTIPFVTIISGNLILQTLLYGLFISGYFAG